MFMETVVLCFDHKLQPIITFESDHICDASRLLSVYVCIRKQRMNKQTEINCRLFILLCKVDLMAEKRSNRKTTPIDKYFAGVIDRPIEGMHFHLAFKLQWPNIDQTCHVCTYSWYRTTNNLCIIYCLLYVVVPHTHTCERARTANILFFLLSQFHIERWWVNWPFLVARTDFIWDANRKCNHRLCCAVLCATHREQLIVPFRNVITHPNWQFALRNLKSHCERRVHIWFVCGMCFLVGWLVGIFFCCLSFFRRIRNVD